MRNVIQVGSLLAHQLNCPKYFLALKNSQQRCEDMLHEKVQGLKKKKDLFFKLNTKF